MGRSIKLGNNMSLYPILKDGKINLKQVSTVSKDDHVIIYRGGEPVTCQIQQIRGTGWAFYDDSEYTELSPLNINNDTAQITIDGLGAFTERRYLPYGVQDLWVNDKIDPENIGDTYSFRLDLTAKAGSNEDKFRVYVDIGDGGVVEILSQTFEINKNIGQTEDFSYSVPLFTLATFNVNNGKIMIEMDDDIDFYNMGIFVQRIHKEA